MKKMTWVFLLPALLLAYTTHTKSRVLRQAAFDPSAIDQFITRQMAAQRVPGLALAITQGDQVLYIHGYGTAGNHLPVTPQTQFFIASVSKSFTALAVMQLVEAGKIDLNAPVQRYLPEFTLADPVVASQITIRELLNHTSGLSETGFPDMQLAQPETIEERVTSLRSAQPVARPGTEYYYFSPNYGILARVVEVVSGQPFSQYIEKHIFVPLEMKQTLSVITSTEGKQKAGDLAQGHLVGFAVPFAYPEGDGYLGGSGGVISTAEDMAHYLIAQANGGRYGNRALVSPESITLMHTPPEGIHSTYAMGWTASVLDGRRVVEHNGILSVYSADVVLLPDERIGIALLYNVSSFATNAFGAPQIREGLIALVNGEAPKPIWMNAGLWGGLTGLLTLAGGFLALRSLLALPRWSRQSRQAPVWKLLPGIVWTFVPALMLVWGIPALTARFAGRVFGFVNLYKSMLGIFTWLALTGVLGAINGTVRVAILLKRVFGSRQEQRSVYSEREHRTGAG